MHAERVTDRRRRVAHGHDLEAGVGDVLDGRGAAIAGLVVARPARLVARERIEQFYRRPGAHRLEAYRAHRLRPRPARQHRAGLVFARSDADADRGLQAAPEALAIAALTTRELFFGPWPGIGRGDIADLELDVGDGDAVVRAGLTGERADIDHERGLGDRSILPGRRNGQDLSDHPRDGADGRKLHR